MVNHPNRASLRVRYEMIVRDELDRMRLTRNEWCAICDANNGYIIFDEGLPDLSWQGCWANVADTPGLGEKWGIDQRELVTQLRNMSLASKAAVAEVVTRFWDIISEQPMDNDEALIKAGVVLREGEGA